MNSQESWLVVTVEARPRFALILGDPGPSFLLEGSRFRSVNNHHAAYFVDRLLDPDGNLVGWSFQGTRGEVFRGASTLACPGGATVYREDTNTLHVYFGPVSGADSDGAQAFGGLVYLSDDNLMGLVVPIEFSDTSVADVVTAMARFGRSFTPLIAYLEEQGSDGQGQPRTSKSGLRGGL